ncbi:thiol:disulfide interchange protein DsbA/DsbL [Photobacterium swingsii]|uniref:thiol:disulfide interchange protein DsbA/DsbL n=1 Tax=Photobacterium swingsii TaxID=680026 RepID=UPI003D0FFD2D
MKKILLPLFVSLLALVGCNDTSTPKEGVQYTTVATPITSTTAPVMEVFSLACGHCRNMDKILPEIQKLADTDIEQVHVTFNESAQLGAYIFYTAAIQSNGHPKPELMEQLFAYTQDKPEGATEEDRKAQLVAIFNQHSLLSPYEISEEQHKQVFKEMAKAEQVVTNAEIASVPAFVVKGKYLVQSDAHESLEDLANTIKYLSQL